MGAAKLDNKAMWNKAKKLWVSLGCLSLLTAFWSAGSLSAAEPEQTIPLADPTIFLDKGTYYLYGTGGLPGSGRDGFLVYTSKDLVLGVKPVPQTALRWSRATSSARNGSGLRRFSAIRIATG